MIGLVMLTKFERFLDGDIDHVAVEQEWQERQAYEERKGDAMGAGQMASDYFPLCSWMEDWARATDDDGRRQVAREALEHAGWLEA